jgi:heme exporter protein D
MHWNSLDDFLHMGGYGLYVWGSYGLCLLAMLAEPVLVQQRFRRAQAQSTTDLNEGNGA